MPMANFGQWALQLAKWSFLLPTIGGSIYGLLCLLAVIRMRTRTRSSAASPSPDWPAVTILKPVYGLEKNQRENLRTTCIQDYPCYQVVFSVQRPDDPALPLLYELEREFGADLVTVAVENCVAGPNGKINNMIGGLRHARHDVLVISDSDVKLQPDYLRAIVPPLADKNVGCVCTLYKAACADTWYEKLELLTLNADLMANLVFAHVTGVSQFCLGASIALRREMLDSIGGLEDLADYLVEDYEMGRRIWCSGKKIAIVPYFVETMVDLKSPLQWWNHQVYFEQNTRAARPVAFVATALIRSTPFALLYALLPTGAAGLAALIAAVALRTLTSALILGWGFKDREGLRSVGLLFFRDLAAMLSWLMVFAKRTTVWRDSEFELTRDGRLVARGAGS